MTSDNLQGADRGSSFVFCFFCRSSRIGIDARVSGGDVSSARPRVSRLRFHGVHGPWLVGCASSILWRSIMSSPEKPGRSNFDRMSQGRARPSFCPPSAWGRVRHGHFPGSIGILEALDKTIPIGIASAIGRTEGHLAVWARCVHGAGVPRRSVIIDSRFVLTCRCPKRARLDSAVLAVARTMNRWQWHSLYALLPSALQEHLRRRGFDALHLWANQSIGVRPGRRGTSSTERRCSESACSHAGPRRPNEGSRADPDWRPERPRVRSLRRSPALLPGPTALFLETFGSLHFLFGYIAQRLDFGADFLPCAGGSPASALINPDGFHHLPKPIRLDWFSDRLDGHVYWSCGKVDFLSHLSRSVRLHPILNDHSRGIHDIYLVHSFADASG